ncbi:MAG: glutathione S-transferase family protein [Pseudomonadota bacterium]|nr:glutathione S-transferase family protein [Pseudomonadota bacterium]
MYRLITGNRNYSSWSLRPWVLMKALDIPFEDQFVSFGKLDNHDDFRLFSPTGKVPLLIDDNRQVWDSLAIMLYLADRHEGVLPSDPDARAWVQAVSAEMHSGFAALRNDCTMNVGARVRRHSDSPALVRDIARIAEIFEEGLTRFGGPFLSGRGFTVADAFFAPVAYRIRTYAIEVGPLGTAWVERILAIPAML